MKKLIIMLACLFTTAANAAFITYTDRLTFDAATGPYTVEDFESFATDTPFHTIALDVGDFILSMVGSPSARYNLIDAPELTSSESDVNGTSHMRVFTRDTPLANLVFTFDTAITSFAADFRSLNDESARTELSVNGEVITLPIGGDSRFFSFFGFTSDTAFTSITFVGLANDVYGIDNVSYGSAARVSEPSTLVIALLGGFMVLMGRRKS
jgi:hypothetical protein